MRYAVKGFSGRISKSAKVGLWHDVSMPNDAELDRLQALMDSLDASIKRIADDGAYRASWDGMYDVSRVEIDRLRNERNIAQVQYNQRAAFLNGIDPFFGGTLRRRFTIGDPDA